MMSQILVVLCIASLVLSCQSFSATFKIPTKHVARLQMTIDISSKSEIPFNRRIFMVISSSAIFTSSLLTFSPNASKADEEIAQSSVQKVQKTIQGCPKPLPGKPNNCVSTSNIKQLDTYSPPWTYQSSADEAFARIKGLLQSSEYTITDIDEESRYIKADVNRFNGVDTVEFLVKAEDNVVVFKSVEKEGPANGISDFGANRKRIEELRKKSNGAFSVMGEGLGTADAYEGGASGSRNGLAGQIKAFYGLQSGTGYEDAFN